MSDLIFGYFGLPLIIVFATGVIFGIPVGLVCATIWALMYGYSFMKFGGRKRNSHA